MPTYVRHRDRRFPFTSSVRRPRLSTFKPQPELLLPLVAFVARRGEPGRRSVLSTSCSFPVHALKNPFRLLRTRPLGSLVLLSVFMYYMLSLLG